MFYYTSTLQNPVATAKGEQSDQPSSSFLRLPGEIRNAIYEDVFEQTSVLIGNFPGRAQAQSDNQWWKEPDFIRQIAEIGDMRENRELFYFPVAGPLKDSPEGQMMEKMMRSTALPPKGRLVQLDPQGHTAKPPGKPWCWAGLLLSCKQIYIEAAPACYARINFVFGCQGSVRALLAHPPHKNCARIPRPIKPYLLAAITQVSLSMDDWPDKKGNPEFQQRYYRSWTRTCETIVSSLPNLNRVIVAVNALYKCPFMLTFKELWVRPLLAFAGLDGLKDFTLMAKIPMGYFVWFELVQAFTEALRVRIVQDDEAAGLQVIAQGMKRYGKFSAFGEDLTSYWHTLATWNGVSLEQ